MVTDRLLRRLGAGDIAWPIGDGFLPEVGHIVERVRMHGDRGVAAIAAELGDRPPREVFPDEIFAAYEATPEPLPWPLRPMPDVSRCSLGAVRLVVSQDHDLGRHLMSGVG
jgi:hypothetical protein